MRTGRIGSFELKRLLVLTLLDYDRAPNHRAHHLVSFLRQRFEEVTLIHRFSLPASSLPLRLGRLLSFRVQVSRDENVTSIRYHPLLNYPEGWSKKLMGGTKEVGGGRPTRWGPSIAGKARRLFARSLNLSGVAREGCFILSLFLTALLRTHGKFDVCIVQSAWDGVVGLKLKSMGRVGLLVYEDIDYSPGYVVSRWRSWWERRLEVYCLKRADLRISVGHLLGELRRSQTGKEVYVVPNGVNGERFQEARRKTEHPPTLVYMGTLAPDWAGLEVCLEALKDLSQEVPAVRMLVLGGGPAGYVRQLQGLATSLGVQDRVRFVGEVAHQALPGYLRECDIGLACFEPTPLRRYAFPIKVLEYMAAGLPVVGTRGTETEGILCRSGGGVAAGFSAPEICQAILSLLRDRERYRRCSIQAIDYSGEFQWNQLLSREYRHIEEAYSRLGHVG